MVKDGNFEVFLQSTAVDSRGIESRNKFGGSRLKDSSSSNKLLLSN